MRRFDDGDTGCAGVIIAGARYLARLNYIRVRVTKNVMTRINASTSVVAKARDLLPPSLLQLIISKNLAQVLNEQKLSLFYNIIGALQYMLFLVIVQIFLFIAFQVPICGAPASRPRAQAMSSNLLALHARHALSQLGFSPSLSTHAGYMEAFAW